MYIVQILKCICPNIEMYLSKYCNIYFQIYKCICPMLAGERLLIIGARRQQGPSYGCISTQLARSYVAANCKQHCNQSCKVFWWTLLPSTSYMLLFHWFKKQFWIDSKPSKPPSICLIYSLSQPNLQGNMVHPPTNNKNHKKHF